MMQQSKIPNNNHIGDELLSERLDDLLTPAETRRVDDHLAGCDECAARYAGLQATRDVLHSLRVAVMPRDFRLDARALSGGKVVAIRRGGRMPRWLSVAALICGLCLIAIGVFGAATPSGTQNAAAFSAHQPASGAYDGCTTCRTSSAPMVTQVPGSDVQSTAKTPQATGTAVAANTPAATSATTPANGTPSEHSLAPFVVIVLGLLVVIAGGIGLWGRNY